MANEMAELSQLIKQVVDLQERTLALNHELEEVATRMRQIHDDGPFDEYATLEKRLEIIKDELRANEGYENDDNDPGLIRQARETLCDYVLVHRDALFSPGKPMTS